MNLVIDIGNSRTKAALFSGGEMVGKRTFDGSGTDGIEKILAGYPGGVQGAILSSTRDEATETEEILRNATPHFIRMDSSVDTPLVNRYETPGTLGQDRLAAAVGANHLYPGQNILVVDFGTALTLDVVTAGGEFLGGNISPGASSRLRSLHDYTEKLPLCEINASGTLIGKNTKEAIETGVANGIIFEIEGYMERLRGRFGELITIFTGGEAEFFVKKLKNTIFANYDLVLIGLNRILEYNASQNRTF